MAAWSTERWAFVSWLLETALASTDLLWLSRAEMT